MKIYYQNNQGFSIVIALGLVLLITISAIILLETIVPFSRATKNIENSVGAYYQTESGLEDAILFISENNVGSTSSKSISSNTKDYGFDIVANGNAIPPSGKGNSDFDIDWNTLSGNDPIKLEVGDNAIANWNNVQFRFRVPDVDRDGSNSDQSLTGTTLPMIHWSIAASDGVLHASGSQIQVQDIDGGIINLANLMGIDLDRSSQFFSTFYGNHCAASSVCSLKLSIINPLILSTNNVSIPYLEYQIHITDSNTIPLRFARVLSTGKSFGFKKELGVNIPQQTVVEALDFTIFQ